MKLHPRLLLLAAVSSLTGALHAATVTFDTAADYTGNFTQTFTSGTSVAWNSNSGGSLAKYDATGSASFVVFNSQAASTSMTLVADVLLLPSNGLNTGYSAGGLSFGFLTNIGAGSGYAAIFRLTGTNTADFRIFEGVNATTGSIGTQVNTTQTFTLASGTWSPSTYYKFNLDVANTGSAISFTGSILTTGNSVLGTFGTYTDNSPVSVTNTSVGFRMGVGAQDTGRMDNFTVPTAPIPEPSTYALLGGAGAFLLALCTRRKHA